MILGFCVSINFVGDCWVLDLVVKFCVWFGSYKSLICLLIYTVCFSMGLYGNCSSKTNLYVQWFAPLR